MEFRVRRSLVRPFALACLFAAAPFAASRASAQVNVTATGGTLAASYTTLKGAFDAINAGTHTGTIGIALVGNTTETAPAVINASGAGAASYASIAVSPSGGAARTISGAIAAGSPLIDFNGADNVTIDGLNTGGNSLTIANTTASAMTGTSTMRFIGGATNNVVTNSNIQGSSSSSVATNGGTIFFSTDAVTTNGNDNNTISNNNIGPAGANLPSKAILGNGSTTTTAIGNSGIAISNNNIFDYFGAATTSAGVATNGGCNTWSITNNRFFQTATRTWTTGSIHAGINIQNTTATSGAQAFTIAGNVVGFASNTQTGTYTLTGAGTGAKFLGILFNGIVTGTTTNVNGNTVASVSMTGVTASGTAQNSPFTAIFLQEGSAVSNGNVVGSQTATGSLVFSTTTANATDVYGIHNFTSNAWTSNSNTVGGIAATNLGAGALVLAGIRALTGGAVTWAATSNTVGGTVANSIQLSATGAASQVLGMWTTIAPAVLTSNTVRNLTSNAGTGTAGGASVIGIALSSTTPNRTLSRNTISNLTNTNATAASVVIGIQFIGSTANLIERNLIYGLTVASNSAAAEVTGIRAADGISTFRNNMVAVGAGTANAIGAAATNTGTVGINGIADTQGTNTFWHNSVYVGGAPTAGAGASYAFNGVQTVSNRSFRDNAFWNARANAGATGKNYAIKINGTVPNPSGLTLNNNVYFANGTGAAFGFFNSADVPNLGAWKIAVGQDVGSIEAHPQFNDPANATPDLHIHPTNPTVVEGNGVDLGVADDFDGQTRSGLTPVDIGADAGLFSGIDLSPPVIAYTPLGNTNLTSNRTLSATIVDGGTGVPVAGVGLPVIYYRKGIAGAFASTPAASAGSGVYNFTIDYSLVAGGSVATGDTIQYYVVAQDGAATPNLAANPAAGTGGFTPNPPAVATPPTTPSSYLIVAPITGIKTVCASPACDYMTLTAPNGAFQAINEGVVTGNVELQITSDIIGAETGTHGLNALNEQPPGSNFTLRLYPTGGPRTVSGSFNGALFRLNGASRITFDGSIGGAGTDRSLTFRNTNLATPSVVLFGSLGATPIANDTLRNMVIVNGINTSSAVVISDATILGNAGSFANITIQNNDIRRAFVGVFAHGGTTPQGGSNLIYTQNKLDNTGISAVRDVGLYMQGVNGATVSDNVVGNIDKVNDEGDVGIWLATGTINATVSGNTVSGIGYTGTGTFTPIGINVTSSVAATNNVIRDNTVSDISSNGTHTATQVRGIAVSGATSDLIIERNNVQGIINTNTGTFGAYGIDLSGGNNITLRNNFVSNVSFNMSGGAAFTTIFGVFGIRVGAGTDHRIYNNSVNLSGALPGTATTSLLTAAFGLVNTTSTGLDVRDNIFANNITGGTTSIAHVSVFLPAGGTSAMNLSWNNNADFFGADAARQGVGQAGATAGTNFFTTLPALAAYSSTLSPAGTNDNASQASTGAAPFVTATDLHLVPSSPLASAGVPLAGVTVDIDNETRSLTAPSIGADEPVADLSITKTDFAANATPGGITVYTITAANAGPGSTTGTVSDTFPAALSCTWTCVGAAGGVCSGSGIGDLSDAVTLPAAGSVTYTATCSISPTATGDLVNTATVAGVAGDPNNLNNTSTDTDTLAPLADLRITKTDGVTTATPGGSVTYMITASNSGPSDTLATVDDTFPGILSCTWTCVGAGGTCTPAGVGSFFDVVNLPAGGSVTYTVSCSISPAAIISMTNNASVFGAATDPVPGNNVASDSDILTPSANLGITKTDGVTSVTAGNSTTYTITASNAGPSDTNATVADTFPASLTCTWGCVGAGGGTCTGTGSGALSDPVSLPAGGSVTYTATCSISASAAGTLANTATVTGVATDPVPGNNSATDSDTVAQSADASITKTDGSTTYTPGGNTTYTIVAANAGPSNTTATVTDTFPGALTCGWGCVGASGGICTGSGSGPIADAVTLPAGGSVTYTATCAISPSASGNLINGATVVTSAADPVPGNNSATDTDSVAASADLAITKTDGVSSVTPGGNTTYTVVASNAGPSDTTATVTDSFPAGLTCNWTCSGTGGASCTGGGSGAISDAAVSLPAGTSVTYTAACAISSASTGSLVNTATVSGVVADGNSANNSATDTDTLQPNADLSISKTVDNATPGVGGNVTFTVTASNLGPSDAASVVVDDLLPAGLTFVTASASSGSYSNTTGLWTIGNLANGASETLSITATVARPESQTNQASVVSAPQSDPRGSNNTAAVAINSAPLVDIQVTQSVDDDTPGAGQSVVFLVTARNAGPSTATGVVLSSSLPGGLTFGGDVPSQGTYTSGTGTWTVGTLASGASATLTLTMTNTGLAPVTQTFSKTASAEADVVTGNDAASVVLNPSAPFADLALSKIATQEPVAAGVDFRYAIVVTNLGAGGATGVTVTDALPAGVTLVTASTSQGNCSGTTTVTCNLGSLAAGGTATIDLTVTKTVGGSVSNTASVAANESDPNPNNNSNVAPTSPVTLLEFEVD
jgi:uncharacterized repeat protein (TIGR01451 family)